MEKLLDKAYEEAQKIIKECVDDIGIKASAEMTGYPQIWARDSMITLLGALFVQTPEIKTVCQKSLETLALYQTELGCIPNQVHIENKKSNFEAYADGNSWFVIGHHAFYKSFGDLDFLKSAYPYIQKSLLFLQYQDIDNTGLISIQEGSDWQDLFAIRGKGLYVNVLYAIALRCGAEIARLCSDRDSANLYKKRAEVVKHKTRKILWPEAPKSLNLETMDDLEQSRYGSLLYIRNKPHFLPYLSFREYGHWFDSFGNILAVISGVADEFQTELILDYITQAGIADPYPIKALHPPVVPGDKDWHEYYRTHNLNIPHQYHNGGIWPFVGGFYIVALVKAGRLKEAKKSLLKLAKANQKGIKYEWEFNEWLHGITGNPMGKAKQAWSAGMYIYAYEVLKSRNSILFE